MNAQTAKREACFEASGLGLVERKKQPTAWRPRTVVLSAEDRETLGL